MKAIHVILSHLFCKIQLENSNLGGVLLFANEGILTTDAAETRNLMKYLKKRLKELII